PDDQYSIDASSKISVDGGIGNDWGVFEVFDNTNTGLQPMAAQGDNYTIVQDLGPDSIRITGYGVDSGTANQTNQTHVGPEMSSSGTTMRYQTDTQGGNSGSPVIDELTGNAVGVHTHGGCNSGGGNNNGTSTFNTAFWIALDIPPADGLDPNPPENLTLYSDYTTPTSMALTWTDPTELFNGTPITPSEFTIEVERDGSWISSVAGGTEQFNDTGLNGGQLYEYGIYAKLVANDSTSLIVT
ncbi:MAG: hypothetical protein GY808_03225, partial [Gammaproteobacteria bacterium]|nr:hypothetical protein [Gammaproteobacteria bacterium]